MGFICMRQRASLPQNAWYKELKQLTLVSGTTRTLSEIEMSGSTKRIIVDRATQTMQVKETSRRGHLVHYNAALLKRDAGRTLGAHPGHVAFRPNE